MEEVTVNVPSHLRENLCKRSMHQPRSPDWHRKHDSPSWCGDCSFGIDCQFDFVELGLDPVFVAAVVVQFAEHLERIVGAVGFYEVPGRFWEEENTADDDEAGEALEG